MLKVSIIIFGIIAIVGGIISFFLFWGMSSIRAYTIADMDLSTITDGEYIGSHKKGRWVTTVKLFIKNQKIDKIEVLKPLIQNEGDFDKAIAEKIISKQSLQIDTVSGATIHTKAFLKACENALSKK